MGRGLTVKLARALRLTCPLCGVSPLFKPLSEVRSPGDWLRILPGCTRCGYPYEREPGYFLLATWVFSYGVGVAVGLTIYFIVEHYWQPSFATLLAVMLPPVMISSLAAARHSKAFFLAIDHFIDP